MIASLSLTLKRLSVSAQSDATALARYTLILRHIEARPCGLLARAFRNLYAF